MSMYKILFLVFFIWVLQPISAKKITKSELSNQLNDTIIHYIQSPKGEVYIISGVDSSKIFKLKKLGSKWIKKEITNYFEPSKNERFTFIFQTKEKHPKIFIGTNNNFIYLLKQHSTIHFTAEYGIADSSLTKMYVNANGETIVCSPHSTYLYTSYKNSKTPCFQRIDLTQENLSTTQTLIKNKIRLPIQKAICNAAAPIDFSFRETKYIKNKDLKQIKEQLKPGDILLRRNNNQLSNVGIPGFWKHAAIYLGNIKEISAYFDTLNLENGETAADLIKNKYPHLYRKLKSSQHLIIEVVGKGVVFNPVAHIAKSDYFAALRTNLTKEELFMCLERALGYYGKEYDFLFDFSTDKELVCSELVYQSFKKENKKNGIIFMMGTLGGNPFLSPNDIATQYANELNTANAQLKLVLFYDANEHGQVKQESEEVFSQSVTR